MFECEFAWDIDNNQEVLNSRLFESAGKTISKSASNDGWMNVGKKKKINESSQENLKDKKENVQDSTDFNTQIVAEQQYKSEIKFDSNDHISQMKNEKDKTIQSNQCDSNIIHKTGVKKQKQKKLPSPADNLSLNEVKIIVDGSTKLPSNDSKSDEICVLKRAKRKQKRKKLDNDKDTQSADGKVDSSDVVSESSAVNIAVTSKEVIDDAVPKNKIKKDQKKCDAPDNIITGDDNINSSTVEQEADKANTSAANNSHSTSSTVASEMIPKITKRKKKRKKLEQQDARTRDDAAQPEDANNNSVDMAQDMNKETIPLSSSSTSNTSAANNSLPSSSKKRDKFQARLERRMAGGQFRWLNERLYTQRSDASDRMFRANADLFRAYHTGFQEQMHTWPSNPVDVFIERLRKCTPSLVVADIGCGDAKLAQSIAQRTFSFDLVALNDRVTVCDMAALPLNNSCVDVAIFCLSLMGTNVSDFLMEAHRVLKPDGVLWVAEVTSRFDEPKTFMEQVSACGFDPVRMDDNNKMFVLFEFIKSTADKADLSHDIKLKPCVYKRR